MLSDLRRSSRLSRVLLLGGLLHSAVVFADAVPPAPEKCPRGQIPITSHAGPQCVAPPPKNCPPGWRPEIRGVCRLATCEKDDQCEKGMQCREADLCIEEYLLHWGYGDASRHDSTRNRPLFAGPPMKYDPPRKVTLAADICSSDRKCAGTGKCEKSKVCLPKDVSRPGAWSGPKPTR